MKIIIRLVIIQLIIFSSIYANFIGKEDFNNNKPISGYIIPVQPTHPIISISNDLNSAKSIYNYDNKNIKYSKIYSGLNSLQQSKYTMLINYKGAIKNNFGVDITLPIILKQNFHSNENENILSGEKGIGDMYFGVWYYYQLSKYCRSGIDLLLSLPSGTYPLNISENNISSTGRGNTAGMIKLSLDTDVTSILQIDFQGAYLYNFQDAFSMKRKNTKFLYGNEIEFKSKLIINTNNKLSIGSEFRYFLKQKDSLNKIKILDTNSNQISITPIIGIKLSNYIVFQLGYNFCVYGKNTPKWNGLYLSGQFYF